MRNYYINTDWTNMAGFMIISQIALNKIQFLTITYYFVENDY